MFRKRDRKELERLRELAGMRFSYTVAGQTILGPVSFEDLALMVRYGYEDHDMRIVEEIARGVLVEHRVWNPRYENVTRKAPEKP